MPRRDGHVETAPRDRRPWRRVREALGVIGQLVLVLGASLCLPALVAVVYGEAAATRAFSLTSLGALLAGLLMVVRAPSYHISWRMALIICVGTWAIYSLIGAIPVHLSSPTGYVNAVFEAVSGFTTTGFTVLDNLEGAPRSLLAWRALMQWMGGLGILSFFLLVAYPGGEAYRLLMMEGASTLHQRPAPGVRGTLMILWRIYVGLTVLNVAALLLLGLGAFDATVHALSTVSTGGFSSHDANIGHFAAVGHPRALGIEVVTVVFMLASGMSFLGHHVALNRQPRVGLFTLENRAYWLLLAAAVLLIAGEGLLWPQRAELVPGCPDTGSLARVAAFQSASVLSSAGFTTRTLLQLQPLTAGVQVLMLLTLVGGCVGSTAGGVKVLRLVVLARFTWHQVRRATFPSRSVMPFTIEGRVMQPDEVVRMVMLVFTWAAVAVLLSVITALLSPHPPLVCLSVAVSAVSNQGPCLVSPTQIAALGNPLKVLYMAVMIAGRLELFPVLTMFSRRVWQG